MGALPAAAEPPNTVSIQFAECVTHATIGLDDSVSPADVIAKAVFAKCRGELIVGQAHSTELTARLLPALTAAVLEHRKLVRQRVPRALLSPAPNGPTGRPSAKPST